MSTSNRRPRGRLVGCPSRFRESVRSRVAHPPDARPPAADSENAESPARVSFDDPVVSRIRRRGPRPCGGGSRTAFRRVADKRRTARVRSGGRGSGSFGGVGLGFVRAPGARVRSARGLGFVRRAGARVRSAPGLGFVRRRGSGSFGASAGRGRAAGRASGASRSAQSRTIANGGGRPGSSSAGVGSRSRWIGSPPPCTRPGAVRNPRDREGHPVWSDQSPCTVGGVHPAGSRRCRRIRRGDVAGHLAVTGPGESAGGGVWRIRPQSRGRDGGGRSVASKGRDKRSTAGR